MVSCLQHILSLLGDLNASIEAGKQMGVNYFKVRMLDVIGRCYGCDAVSQRPLCIPCQASLETGPFILSALQTAVALRSPISDRLLARFAQTGHRNTLKPWLPMLLRALPVVPTALVIDRSDPLITRLASELARQAPQFAITGSVRTALKQVQLQRRPVIDPERPTLALLTH